MKNIKISFIIFILNVITLTVNSIYAHDFVNPRPNVIVIMTDDQGYPELSIHGNPILKTPNLDKLARNSVRFGDFHTSPMCAPTRGQLMTGVDAAANGLVNVSSGRAFLKPELPTMGNIFMANGYSTGVLANGTSVRIILTARRTEVLKNRSGFLPRTLVLFRTIGAMTTLTILIGTMAHRKNLMVIVRMFSLIRLKNLLKIRLMKRNHFLLISLQILHMLLMLQRKKI
jgi:hypothetical protein